MLEVIIYITDVVLLFVLGIMIHQLRKVFKRQMAPLYTSKFGGEVDLPSVTVCIPARNEQHALTECLQRVSASTYQRLEVIVLDDVSGDDTSALIKSFASEGVRFVKGEPLPKGWLGKNYALQGLLEKASGSYVLFMDVDTLLAPKAIENMVRYSLSHRDAMVSVLPRREDGWRASIFMSPLRYFWELIFQRRLWPATSSNAWMIRRDVLLHRFNGFMAFKNTTQPEAKIAAELAATKEYAFLVSTKEFGVFFEKKWRSQLDTSIRLLYPLLGKQSALVIMAALDLLALLVPFVVLCAAMLGVQVPMSVIVINAAIALGFCVLYGTYSARVWNKGWFIGVILWPVIVLQEIILVCASGIQHGRKTVKWKGRLIRPEAQS